MTMRTFLAAALLCCACGGAEPVELDAGTTPPVQTQTPDPTYAINCTPGKTFCPNAEGYWQCTLSGHDAIIEEHCSAQGKTCATTGCAAGFDACCR
jgi:hypothetical protein